MTRSARTIGAHADLRPSDYRFTRRQTLPGEWEHTSPLRSWGRDMAAGIGFVAFTVFCLWGLGPVVTGFWALIEVVRGG